MMRTIRCATFTLACTAALTLGSTAVLGQTLPNLWAGAWITRGPDSPAEDAHYAIGGDFAVSCSAHSGVAWNPVHHPYTNVQSYAEQACDQPNWHTEPSGTDGPNTDGPPTTWIIGSAGDVTFEETDIGGPYAWAWAAEAYAYIDLEGWGWLEARDGGPQDDGYGSGTFWVDEDE